MTHLPPFPKKEAHPGYAAIAYGRGFLPGPLALQVRDRLSIGIRDQMYRRRAEMISCSEEERKGKEKGKGKKREENATKKKKQKSTSHAFAFAGNK